MNERISNPVRASRVLLHSALGDDDAIVGVTMQVQIRHSFQKRVELEGIKARTALK
jgi:hypothetical protein